MFVGYKVHVLFNLYPERFAKDPFSFWGYDHGPGPINLTCPTIIKAVGADQSSYRAAQMGASLAPIKTGAA
jgi:hypothetical protein